MPTEAREDVRPVLVLVPTYNERENLPMIVGRIRAALPDADVLVLDDNSPDGTGELADGLAADDSQIRVLHRQGKEGLGAAYLAGFAWGMEHGYHSMVEIDADGSHQPEDLPRLIAALEHADLVIGSRWIKGGAIENWPAIRKVISIGGNVYTKAMLGMSVNDATAGFRAYRASALAQLNLAGVQSQGYCFQIDLTRRAVRAGLRVVEVPITFIERTVGESKMDKSIVREALSNVTLWGVKHRAGQVKQVGAKLSGRRP